MPVGRWQDGRSQEEGQEKECGDGTTNDDAENVVDFVNYCDGVECGDDGVRLREWERRGGGGGVAQIWADQKGR